MRTRFRPESLDIRTDELRDLVRRSREVVLLAAVTGAITGVLVRYFEYVVAEVAFHRLLHVDWRWGLIVPGLGLVASALILRTVGGGATPATSDEYLRAFHDPEYPLRWRAFVARIAASFTTLGSGGAMGLEGPSMYGGSALGAIIQRRLPASFRGADYRTLLVAGAAAGVAAIFKAPATGAIFALEVPFRDQMARRMLLPALVASASGYLTFAALSSTDPIFTFAEGDRVASLFQYVDLFGAVLIGIGCALGARMFSRVIRAAKSFTLRPLTVRLLASSLALTVLFFVTRLVTADGWDPGDGESLSLGSGYEVFAWLFEPQALWVLIAVFFLRMLATAATLAGGGVGGVFIPLVVGGAIVGRAVGEVFDTVDPALYVLLGIAAFLGAGYEVFAWLFEPQALWVLIAVFFLRMLATAATLAGGGVGGVFIPLVVGGAIVGRAVGEVFDTVDPALYVLLGIAAFLGAGYRVPLAAVMFVAETTGQPGFIVPALFAAVAADLVMGEESITTFQRSPTSAT